MSKGRKKKTITKKSLTVKRTLSSSKRNKFSAKDRKTPHKPSLLEVRNLIEELQKSRHEVELLNEELRKLQERFEVSRKKYAELYDFSPIGYFTLDKRGLIVEVNLTGANMLGLDRRLLINKPFSAFVDKSDAPVFQLHHTNVFKELCHLTCEIKLKRKDGTKFSSHLQSIAVEDAAGNLNHCRTSVIYQSEYQQHS
jgi:PAS domain S-box-containing protein